MSDVLVAGETLVDFLPGPGATLREVDGFTHRPGGAPANVAVGLSRLGPPPAFWTRLGDDGFGDFLEETLVARDVRPTRIERVAGNTTIAVVSPAGADGRRFRFYGSRDVTFGFDPASIPTDALAAASWVHLGGVVLTHPDGRAATRELAAAAAEHGCTVSFDVNYRPDLVPDDAREAVLAALRDTVAASDVVLCSDEEVAATGLSSEEGPALAADLLDLGPHTAVVTRGGDGAAITSTAAAPWGDHETTHPGFDVDVVDTTGAGDAFTAGLLARLSAGTTDLDDAIAFANATAALSVGDLGGMSAVPTRERVERFLDDR